jgi:isoleucyl-tRNA synthetase
LEPLDRWVLAEARAVARRLAEAYERYEFHVVYHTLVNFCATTLSAFYLDVIKDRLYASRPDSPERRSAQTALDRIARILSTLSAPVLPFTAEEIWTELQPRRKNRSTCRVSRRWATFRRRSPRPKAWERLRMLRQEVNEMLEEARRRSRSALFSRRPSS